MGAYAAPIFHYLLSPSPSNPNSDPPTPKHRRTLLKLQPINVCRGPLPILRRQLLLLSLPISLPIYFTSSSPAAALANFDLLTPEERDASALVSRRVADAVKLLETGRELQARGDFNRALECFTQVIENYKDFALSDYARVGRALALYEVGDRQEAIAEMEDVPFL